ncbi:Rhodanese-like domain-containing protein [Myxozyma melibiosi]|uniref:M-phase inducer phosphatase n=1 Tax=Myxozyma melibiosi TaxID=54550 RepID=A0ABR1F711_9ASCO
MPVPSERASQVVTGLSPIWRVQYISAEISPIEVVPSRPTTSRNLQLRLTNSTMDRSSPLAAMPPPSAFGALFRARTHTHQVSLPSVRDFDSPTSTLAADLSQNFHINRSSPVTATPRRSLMQSFSFGKAACDKTPPVNLHSSPSADGSDLSPLPHKPLTRPPIQRQASRGHNGSGAFTNPLADDLDRAFDDSPYASRTVALGLDAPRAPAVSSLNGGFRPAFRQSASADSDSPLSGLATRPAHRPNRKMRRTQSMFQKPEEFVAAVSPHYEPDYGNVNLPSLPAKDAAPFRYITPNTMIDVLEGKYANSYDRLVVIDCRFEYEYQGGHIDGAINLNGAQELEEHFLSKRHEGRYLLIFHCEYSHERAPRMACHLRACDRQKNLNAYPKLDFPDVYILEGGYQNFFATYRSRCKPQQYVKMSNERFSHECEREMNRFRKSMKRTATFAGSTAGTSLFSGASQSSSFSFPLPRASSYSFQAPTTNYFSPSNAFTPARDIEMNDNDDVNAYAKSPL